MRVVFCLLASCSSVVAEDWPGWRGPRGDGTSVAEKVPLDFAKDKRVKWSAEVAGSGYSSPIVVGKRVFLTTCLEKERKRVLLCLDRETGKELWRDAVLEAKLEDKHHLNSYASSTPACDGERVYVTFLAEGDMQAACYTAEGKKLWMKSPGKLLSRHGFCTSPVLHEGLVILNGDQDAKAYIVALDKKTGEEKWRADRPNRTRSYCTPILVKDPVRKGVTQLVLSGSKCVTGYDAATGKLLWILDGPTEQYVASLVPHKGILFLTTGYPEYHLMGLRADGEGRINDTKHVAWHIGHKENGPRGASYVPSPLAHEGYFYVVSDAGYLGCIEAETGKRLWLKKLGRRHSASPVLVRGRMIIPDDDGKVWVVKASPKFEVERTTELGEGVFASPAVAGEELYIRTTGRLWCFGK
ncbi:MAG: PQQ-binding-like beta-propeller repeat protein [Gemmataceae bacterium]|nr:PQQ-binding-like beta-propeller repeat protein [Gemmataceae bacterium]